MINIIRLNMDFLVTKKFKIISLIIIVITCFILVFISNITKTEEELSYNVLLYQRLFLYEGFNIVKVIGILLSMLVVINGFLINDYDLFIITRVNRKKTLIGKVIAVFLTEIYIMTYIYLIFVILYGVLYTELTFNITIMWLIKLIFFQMYYSLIFIMLTSIYKSVFIVILPFVGYLVSSFSIDFDTDIDGLSNFSKMINFVFPDLIVFQGEIGFLYGVVFVFGGCILLFIITFKQYLQTDLS